MTHNERLCHEAGERRQNYLNQIKCILEKMDDTPCVPLPSGNLGHDGTPGQASFEKPLIEYPGYINRLNPKFNKPFYEPLIPNVMAERRLYCGPEGQDYSTTGKAGLPEVCRGILTPEEFAEGGGRRMPPAHSVRSKQAELKMGYMVQGCDCRKHNGLQDRCERSECGGRPPCLTQPDPSCGPASNYDTSLAHQKTREEAIEEALASWNRPKLQYCCCTPACGTAVATSGKQETGGMGAEWTCYPCSGN